MLICFIEQMSENERDEIIRHEEGANKQALSQCLQNGVECAVLDVECMVEDVPGHNYYNIVFKGGEQVTGIAGVHLKGIHKWKD